VYGLIHNIGSLMVASHMSSSGAMRVALDDFRGIGGGPAAGTRLQIRGLDYECVAFPVADHSASVHLDRFAYMLTRVEGITRCSWTISAADHDEAVETE
jgi:hypothetical protein